MKNENLKTNDQELANVEPADLAASVTDQEVNKALGAAASGFDIDSMFELSEEDMVEEEVQEEIVSDWRFPGVKVKRGDSFMWKGKKCYPYLAKVNLPWNGELIPMEVEMQSPDKKNPGTYTKLDRIFDKLPGGQKYLLLGFRYVQTRNGGMYNYCVEMKDAEGVTLRVTLQPRNTTGRDDLETIIGVLRQHGKL